VPENSTVSEVVLSNSPCAVARNVVRNKDVDFSQCLKQYAVAALGVAGMSAVAAAQAPAHQIWYTAVNIPLTTLTPTTVPIDFNHDGITDLTISVTGGSVAFSGHGGAVYGSINETPAPGNFAIGGHAIPLGVPIDLGGAFKSARQQLAFADYYVVSSVVGTISNGPFKNVTNKYLGVKILIGGQTHEGWVRLTLNLDKGKITGAITGYAFNTLANAGIAAGQIRPVPPATASVEKAAPGSLGMLAAGSSAIPYWRK
jgi:hypothetical protein